MPPKKRTMDPDGKRLRVLEVALDQLAAKGFDGCNTAEIAKRAGVGAGTVFRIFNTKEALANAVFQHCKELYAQTFAEKVDMAAPPRQQFAGMFAAMVAMYREHRSAFVFYELQTHASFLDAAGKEARAAFRKQVQSWIEASQAAGVLKTWPAAILRALVIGAFARAVREAVDGNLVLEDALLVQLEEASWQAIARA